MNDDMQEPQTGEMGRRSLIKRAAILGAATAWATPTVQSIAGPAFATGTPQGDCTARMTGGGRADMEIVGATYNGGPAMITFGLGQLLCLPPPPGSTDVQIQVNAHKDPAGPELVGNRQSWHFIVATITCSKMEPNPSPGPNTAPCANVFTGTAVDRDDDNVILTFTFEDHGEGHNSDLDRASIHITGGGDTLSGAGQLSRGNLQVHDNIPGVTRDCSGC